MQAGANPLLDQLRDIHAADAPGWWPPAPGWWLLAALLLMILVVIGRSLAAKWAVRRRRRRYLDEITRLDATFDADKDRREYLAAMNRLFRAVALRAFPDTACARMQGDEWVTFLRSLLPEGADTSVLSALSTGPYQPAPEFDREPLLESARTWVKLYG